MAGLLDFLDSDEARFGMSLLSAAGPQAVPASFGQRMAAAVSNYRDSQREDEERGLLRGYREMQTESLRQQALERQEKLAARGELQDQLRLVDPSGRLGLLAHLDPQGAAKMLMPQRPQVGNIDPGKYTPQSVAQFSQTGDFNVLQPRDKREIVNGMAVDPYAIQPGAVIPDPNKPFSLGPEGRVVPNQALQQYEMNRARAGATNIAVNAGPKEFWGDVGKSASDVLFKERETASAAAATLKNINQIRESVNAGAYQGTGADLKLGAAKALSALGMQVDPNKVANTEAFNAVANQFVLGQIKQLGANPSNADLQFLQKTVPSLTTDPAALPKLLDFMSTKATSQVGAYNTKAKSLQGRPEASFLPFSLQVDIPPQPLPSAQPKASDLTPGVVYQTPRGPKRWTGLVFED